MNDKKTSKHIEFLSVAVRNIGRFRSRTAAILIPLFIVMAASSAMTFVKDGMLRDSLSSLKDAPDLTLRRISEGKAAFADEALARDVSSYEAVRKVVPVKSGYSEIGVYLKESQYAGQISGLIGASHENVQVFTKDMLADTIKQWYGGRSGIFQLMWLILLLTVLLLAWTQASSMSLEMKREIGVLKSFGWQTLDIIELKMIEISIIGLSGILGGIFFGVLYSSAGAQFFKQYFFTGERGGAYPGAALPIYIDPASVLLIFVIGLLPLCAATIFPIWLMGSIDPDSAIRGGDL